MDSTSDNNTFSQAIIFVAQAGFALDVAAAAGACKASWWDDRLWNYLARVDIQQRTALYSPIAAGGTNRVSWLLDHFPDLDARFERAAGQPPLRFAIEKKQDAVAALLVRRAISISNSVLWASLPNACERALVATVTALLDRGTTVNSDGYSTLALPLHLAVLAGSETVTNTLLDRGADIDAIVGRYPCDEEVTPLHVACKKRNVSMFRLLLARGASPHAKSCTGRLPLHFACAAGCEELVNLLLAIGGKAADLTHIAGGYDHQTPVHSAIEGRNQRLAIRLLELGLVDISKRTWHGQASMLDIACARGLPDVALWLLAHGAQMSYQPGVSQLHRACRHGMAGVVTALLKADADHGPYQADSEGRLPIHVACKVGDLDTVKAVLTDKLLMLESRGNVSRYGVTPLLEACGHGHVAVVRYLLEKGASINASSSYHGMTPLHTACAGGHHETARVLIRAGADVHATCKASSMPLAKAVEKGSIETVRLLLDAGASPNAGWYHVATGSCLIRAMNDKRTDIALLLLDHGADYTRVGTRGFPALQIARQQGLAAVVQRIEDLQRLRSNLA